MQEKKLTPEEYRAYVDSLNSYRDLKNSLDYAKAEGLAEGKAEGLAEGEQERLKLLQEIEELKRLRPYKILKFPAKSHLFL